MNLDSHQITHLKALLRAELQKCAHNHWPFVCRMKEEVQGLARIETYVLQLASAEGMSIGSGLAQLENHLRKQHPIT